MTLTTTPISVHCPTTVYVIVTKDTHGFMRGFEKAVNGRFYMDYAEALDALRAIAPSYTQSSYRVGEAVIGWWPVATESSPHL
jgi:hypothetical protein